MLDLLDLKPLKFQEGSHEFKTNIFSASAAVAACY